MLPIQLTFLSHNTSKYCRKKIEKELYIFVACVYIVQSRTPLPSNDGQYILPRSRLITVRRYLLPMLTPCHARWFCFLLLRPYSCCYDFRLRWFPELFLEVIREVPICFSTVWSTSQMNHSDQPSLQYLRDYFMHHPGGRA